MDEYCVQGVCLQTKPIGEHDLLLTVFTDLIGVVRIYARNVGKGSRRAWATACRPSSLAEWTLHRGRADLWSLQEASLLYYPEQVHHEWSSLQDTMQLLEAVSISQWLMKPVPALFELMIAYLQQMDHSYSPSLLPSFYLKVLTHEGLFPMDSCCSVCEESSQTFYIDHEGTILCEKHRQPSSLELNTTMRERWNSFAQARSFTQIRALTLSGEESLLIQEVFRIHFSFRASKIS